MQMSNVSSENGKDCVTKYEIDYIHIKFVITGSTVQALCHRVYAIVNDYSDYPIT